MTTDLASPSAPCAPSRLQGVPGSNGLVRRLLHERVVDATAFVLALLAGVVLFGLTAERLEPLTPGEDLLMLADAAVGLALCVSLWWRRRWPVTLAVVALTLGAFSAAGAVAGLMLAWTAVVSRPLRTTLALVPLLVAAAFVYPAVHPDPELSYGWDVVLGMIITAVVVLAALYVRARRQLATLALERAQAAVVEREQQVAHVRRLERARIAREMHDVLGHRLSLLSMHAGALEYRPDAPPRELAEAAGVVRRNAHAALQELRDVIDVLREDPQEQGDHPLPTLADVPALVEESRTAGRGATLHVGDLDLAQIPAALGRTAYRIVQEGLTNARKHAPGAVVEVTLRGSPGEHLDVEVRNPLRLGGLDRGVTPGAGIPGAGIPGAGTGLVGLRERTELLGGRLEHGVTEAGDFRLAARLPWPA